MMPKFLISSFLAAFVSLCACEEKKSPGTEAPKTMEIDHSSEELYSLDTVMDGTEIGLSLEKKENAFIMANIQKDSGLEMHIYPDVYLEAKINGKTYLLPKDSLLVYINNEYLQEALISNIQVSSYDKETAELSIYLELKKPSENFNFPFIWVVSAQRYELSPIDE